MCRDLAFTLSTLRDPTLPYPAVVISTRWAALVLLPALLTGCSDSTSPSADPGVAASAPLPGVTLPPDSLRTLVPAPDEVPAGMTPLLTGSGPRDLAVVASYSGTGPEAEAARTKLTAHGFSKAYVAQYANQMTAQSITVLVSEFRDARGAAADLTDDIEAFNGKVVPTETLGEQSQVSIQETPGAGASQLVLVRFRKGVHTWLVSYSATPTADPKVATDLAELLLSRA